TQGSVIVGGNGSGGQSNQLHWPVDKIQQWLFDRMSSLKNYLRNLNFFSSDLDTNAREDEQQRSNNIIATRVYLIVLLISLISIGIFIWVNSYITTVTLKYLTKEQLKNLPVGTKCPCSRISISYGEFTSLEPTYHQICSSDFISDRWINAIYTGSNATYFNI
ncbi:unnamed protein product, partial [Rotaria sp. Silwood1]